MLVPSDDEIKNEPIVVSSDEDNEVHYIWTNRRADYFLDGEMLMAIHLDGLLCCRVNL